MLAILWLLKTKKRMSAKQLVNELKINIRSVYHYIDAFCASSDPAEFFIRKNALKNGEAD
jgi:predicted DNA-binding transcriptional regulator YafY